jgi:hypothetical protein
MTAEWGGGGGCGGSYETTARNCVTLQKGLHIIPLAPTSKTHNTNNNNKEKFQIL